MQRLHGLHRRLPCRRTLFSSPCLRATAPQPAARWARRALSPFAVACIVAYIFFGVVLFARVTNHWNSELPRAVYMQLVPHADDLSHPGM